MKTYMMNVFVEHRPQVIKSYGQGGGAASDLTVLNKKLDDLKFYPDVYTNLVDSLMNSIEYLSSMEPDVH